jgi:ATP-dependent helicase HrpB
MGMKREQLPIYDVSRELADAVAGHGRVILTAPTGSGKSTQVPQMLVDMGMVPSGRIVVLQPRRIAARMLARRVARERGVQVGGEVGYQVRFDRKVGPDTRIVYETDGIILRELLSDPSLRGVGAIVFDEFHERHLHGDMALALALRLQATDRPDLKLIVMSATLQHDPLQAALAPCGLVTSEGRTYPVTVSYTRLAAGREAPAVWDSAAEATGRLLAAEASGDVLIFMPGAYEIRRTIEALGRERAARGVELLPLHGELSPDQQDRAVTPGGRRKVVVATNVAETSLTIDGITAVVDSGLARKACYDPHRGINTLMIEPISQASADQRAGRAGRTRPGQCVRLWSESSHKRRDAAELPEVLRVDLAETVLQLRVIGISDVDAFFPLEVPDAASLARSEQLLTDLGALDEAGAVSECGRRLLRFPLHPRVGRMLLAGEWYGCVPSVCLLAALVEERGILLRRVSAQVKERRLDLRDGRDESDLLLMAAAWHYARRCGYQRGPCDELGIHAQAARRVEAMRDQLLRIAAGAGLDVSVDVPTDDAMAKCVLLGFADQVAKRLGGGSAARCELVHGRRGTVSRESCVGGEHSLLVAAGIQEIGHGRGTADVVLSDVTAIREAWLHELFPDAFGDRRHVAYDAVGKRVRAELQVAFRDLVVSAKVVSDVTDDEAAPVLAAEVVQNPKVLKRWDAKVEAWIARVNLVAAHCPELQIPAIDDEGREFLLEQVCLGLRGLKEVKQAEVWPALRSYHSREQRVAVEAYAPERVKLSNGREPKVHYVAGQAPYIAQRIQELYDVVESPVICMGRARLQVHILAPSQRPVQITDDLASFWEHGYPRAKKDLRGRYPRHEWR